MRATAQPGKRLSRLTRAASTTLLIASRPVPTAPKISLKKSSFASINRSTNTIRNRAIYRTG